MIVYVGGDTPLARYLIRSDWWQCDRLWTALTSNRVEIHGFTLTVDWTELG